MTPKQYFAAATLAILAITACTGVDAPPAKSKARFDWFEYQGKDAVFSKPLEHGQYQNPIVAGFFPDPSITRVGDDFYMTHSSFAYYPGLPILHSTDLVNWRLIGHAADNAEHFDFTGLGVSRGIFAPTIRHHDGTFYLITTAVDAGGNFLITAENPAGPWSAPIWLPEVGGIDPDIFFDDNGKVYITHNDAPPGEPQYDGHRAIWMWEYNPDEKRVVPDSRRLLVNGGTDISKEPVWIEAPHLFKKDGWYYLSCAEGGTGYNHSQVIFRSRSLDAPFVPYENNPILTQRDLDIERPDPVTTAGHADMVTTPTGEWWAVFLATRAYDQTLYNTGRETFLLPVEWRNEWPHILPAGERIPYRLDKPQGLPTTPGAEPTTGNFTWRDDFDDTALSAHWNLLRSGDDSWLSFDNSAAVLQAKAIPLSTTEQPALIARRQQHTTFDASTRLNLPLAAGISAGLTAYQNARYHYFLGVRRVDDGYEVFLEKAEDGAPQVIHSQTLAVQPQGITLGAEGNAGAISFFYTSEGGEKTYLARDIDARMLSTGEAGGFVGTHLGLHARLDTQD